MSDEKPVADAASLPLEGLPRKEFAPAARAPFRVRLKPGVHGAVWAHGREAQDRELCGVLLGRVWKDEAGPFLDVEDWVRGEHARSDGAQVTFTHETWDYIHEEIRRRHPKEPPDIVGWYHTHPGFGIFLSEMDLFIHSNFFSAPSQVALVLDPRSGEEGMFGWVAGKVERLPSHWVGDREVGGGAAPASGAADVPHTRPRDPDELDLVRLAGRIRAGTVLALLWGLLLGWLGAQLLLSWQVRGYVSAAAGAELEGLVRAGILSQAQERELREIAARARDLAETVPGDRRAEILGIAERAERGALLAAERNAAVDRALAARRLVATTGELADRVEAQSRQVRRLQALVEIFAVAPAWNDLRRALREGKVTPDQAEERVRAFRDLAERTVREDPDLEETVRTALPDALPAKGGGAPPPEGKR